MGPHFDGMGSRLSPDEIRQAILDPAACSPGSSSSPVRDAHELRNAPTAAQLEALVGFLSAREGSTVKLLRHPFWQAAAILVVAYVLIAYGIPYFAFAFGMESAPVPGSVVLQYMVTVLVVLIWVSDSDERWNRFLEPIRATMVDGRSAGCGSGSWSPFRSRGPLAFRQVRQTVAPPACARSIPRRRPRSRSAAGRSISPVSTTRSGRRLDHGGLRGGKAGLLPELPPVPRRRLDGRAICARLHPRAAPVQRLRNDPPADGASSSGGSRKAAPGLRQGRRSVEHRDAGLGGRPDRGRDLGRDRLPLRTDGRDPADMGRSGEGPNDATTRLSGVAAAPARAGNAGRQESPAGKATYDRWCRLPWGGRKRRGSRSRDDAAPAARLHDRQVPDPVDERMLPTDEDRSP